MSDPKMPTFGIPDEVRNVAERSVEQGRTAIDSYFGAMRKMLDSMQSASPALPGPAGDMTRKTFDYTQQNLNAAFDYGQRLLRAKDPQEAMQIQTEFLNRQVTATQEQLRGLVGGVQQAASGVTQAAQQQMRDAADSLQRATDTKAAPRKP